MPVFLRGDLRSAVVDLFVYCCCNVIINIDGIINILLSSLPHLIVKLIEKGTKLTFDMTCLVVIINFI